MLLPRDSIARPGADPADSHRLLTQLETIKESVRTKHARSSAMADQVSKFQREQAAGPERAVME